MAAVLTRCVRSSRRFRASRERVFAAWLDPTLARRWLFATATQPMGSVEIDARVGGRLRVVDAARRVEYRGNYVEIDPPSRLVFALSLEGEPAEPTRVVVEIAQTRSGCSVTVVHHDVPRVHTHALADRWCGMLYGLGEILASTPAVQHRTLPVYPTSSTFAWRTAP